MLRDLYAWKRLHAKAYTLEYSPESSREFAGSCGLGDFVGFGSLVLEEAEGGIALSENPRLQETSEALGELVSSPVLGDYQAALAEKWGGAEEAEDAVVLIFFGVRRVDEREIEWGIRGLVACRDFFECTKSVERENLRAVGDFERLEIAADQDSGGRMVLDEDYFGRATADAFDAHGSGAGEDVQKAGAADVGAENVEEGFAQAIASWAEGVALQGLENAAAIFTGDDAHLIWDVGQQTQGKRI